MKGFQVNLQRGRSGTMTCSRNMSIRDRTPFNRFLERKTIFKDQDKREVYANPAFVDTYDRRLYLGRSGGLFHDREKSGITGWFPSRGRILDAPCGTGKLGRFLQEKHGLELIGMDISKPMIMAAADTKAYSHLTVGDLSNLPYPNESFDVVYISRFFMLFKDINPFLEEIARVLRPKGLFIFDNIRYSIHNLINATFGTPEGWNYPRKSEVMSRIIQENGFHIVDRRSAFLISTTLMNRIHPFLFKLLSALERFLPECFRVMEFYKATVNKHKVKKDRY